MRTAFIQTLTQDICLTGKIGEDALAFLLQRGYPKTAEHCRRVAAEARRLAVRFGADPDEAEQAGWLHDVSAVIPDQDKLQAARSLEIDVLFEEEAYPPILHQKLSAALARQAFGVVHPSVLSAIGCHTTLKAGASRLDKIVFIADKIAWDGGGDAPAREKILVGLQQSLDLGVFIHLQELWQRRERLPCVHPWFVEAYREFKERNGG